MDSFQVLASGHCVLFLGKTLDSVSHKYGETLQQNDQRINTYTLFDGLSYSTHGYFASCIVMSE